jgi:hypothetical protein
MLCQANCARSCDGFSEVKTISREGILCLKTRMLIQTSHDRTQYYCFKALKSGAETILLVFETDFEFDFHFIVATSFPFFSFMQQPRIRGHAISVLL